MQNPIRKLTLRSRMGAGAKGMLMRKSNDDKTSLSAALLSAYEKHQTDGDEPGTSTWRWSVRLKRDLAVASKIDLSTGWFLQLRIDAVEDYLVDGIVQISKQLTERVRVNCVLSSLSRAVDMRASVPQWEPLRSFASWAPRGVTVRDS